MRRRHNKFRLTTLYMPIAYWLDDGHTEISLMARCWARESIQTDAGAERQIYRIERRSGNNSAQNRSVQQVMVERGRARVSARVGDKACADGLSNAERAARPARRGLRADPNFAPLSAKNCEVAGRVGPIRAGGRQGLVGTRERDHYRRGFQAGLDAGFHRDHSATHGPHPCRDRRSTENARRPPRPGAQLDRTARWPRHRGRSARADRILPIRA